MSRPSDWSPVDLDTDPTPGDPVGVARAARHYAAVAEAIETAAGSLRRIAQDADMESKAVTTFVEKSSRVAEEVSRAETRYARAGRALGTYATALESAQDEADGALRDARWAENDIAGAKRRLDSAHEGLRQAEQNASRLESTAAAAGTAIPPRDLSWEQALIGRSESELDEAESRLASARTRAAAARERASQAADRARRDINDVVEHDGLSDSFWDKAATFIQKVADVAGAISAIAGIAALAVGWIPVIGQALAAVLGTVALIAGAISLIANLTLLVGGKGSVTDTILDAVGLATFGLGKAIGVGGKAVYRGAQGAARRSAGQLAALPKAERAARGLPTHGDALRTISDLTGGGAAARMSKREAWNAMKAADRTRVFTAGNVVRGTADDFHALRDAGRTLSDPDSWRAAWSQTGDGARSVMSGSLRDGLAGAGDRLLRYTDDPSGFRPHQAVTQTAQGSRADNLVRLDSGNATAAGLLDSYQTFEAVSGLILPEPMSHAGEPGTMSR